jgi:transglutaminase-like putative cysteine protease
MRYTVRHQTTYRYADDVAYARMIAHLAPRQTPTQNVHRYHVSILPTPSVHRTRTDAFGNSTDWVVIDSAHQTLEFLAESQVFIEPAPAVDLSLSSDWESARALVEREAQTTTRDVIQYIFDSPMVQSVPEITDYARTSFTSGRSLYVAVRELTRRIHADFRYDPTVTHARTTVAEAFALRAGVCQDFAHIGIAAMRSLGLPARYVSGYLRTLPPPGHERLVGADASHAWFSAWIPPFGWIDFDPTNDVVPRDEHITVAWGRDYGDVAPIHGIITGGSEQMITVGVDVIPLLDEADASMA